MDPDTRTALLANILKATETRHQKREEADEAYITELRQLLAQQMSLTPAAQDKPKEAAQ